MNVTCVKAPAQPWSDPSNLEELAVMRMEALKGHGAEFYAYSKIVRTVETVLMLEERAARARVNAIQTLSGE